MPRLGPRTPDTHRQVPVSDPTAREKRKNRVMSIVADGFPVPNGRVFELIRLLNNPVMDLGGVSELLQAEPSLGAQILGLLNSSPLEEYRRPMRVSEAVVLLGSERLRILILGCALADFARRRLPAETVRGFWHHSILSALLSERIAREVQPEAVDHAYFGGLLHDIGQLPLLIVAHEQEGDGVKVPSDLHDDLTLERAHFGVDHCEVGRWIALCGNFSPWMADVIEHHHDPSRAAEDSTLTAIVAAGDRYSRKHSNAEFSGGLKQDAAKEDCGELLFGRRPSNLLGQDRAAHSRFLESSTLYTPFPRFGSC
jgi:putative nucleotidyltransferase with HDIG domain